LPTLDAAPPGSDPGPRDGQHTIVTANHFDGVADGPVVQARHIAGGVHFHAPAHSDRPIPRQLPPPTRWFVNRDHKLEWLAEHAADGAEPTVLVVTGTAGVGKSALAVFALHRLADRFPDGQLYANLGASSASGQLHPSEVAARFLRALGVARRGVPDEPEERTTLLRTLAYEKRISILLDDAATAAQVSPVLPAAPGSLTVVTTRAALTGLLTEGAQIRKLVALTDGHGRLLLRSALGGKRVDSQRRAVADLVDLCGGHPLALAITAARLAAHPTLHIATLARELDELSAEDETITVTAAFNGAYARLPEDLAELYRVLGDCPAQRFDRHLVAALLGTAPAHAARRLSRLAERNLLDELDDGHYSFPNLLHLHAHALVDHAHPAERDAAHRRMIDYFLSAATHAEALITPSHRTLARTYHAPPPAAPFDTTPAALTWLEDQHPNLMAVLHFCANQGLSTSVWQLVDAMWPVWLRFRHPADRLEAQTLALEAARDCCDDGAVGRFLTSMGGTCASAGRTDDAVDFNRQALAHFEHTGDERGVAQACNGLGKCHLERGELDLAELMFTRALHLREDLGYHRGVGLSQQGLGRVEMARSHWREAASWLRARSTRSSPNKTLTTPRGRSPCGRRPTRTSATTTTPWPS
jgi:tetratricopeptide (TPR) repeat protein